MRLTVIDYSAILLGLVLVGAYTTYTRGLREATPATDFFEVKNIAIPNFIQGQDPNIIYDRQIKKPFAGTWSVEIQPADGNSSFVQCFGSADRFYEPTDKIPDAGVSMSWFLGDHWLHDPKCLLPEGQYFAKVHWELRPSGYGTKSLDYFSNLFRVLPKGAQLYITPDQADKLKELSAP